MIITEEPAPLEAPREWTPSNRGPPAAGGHHDHDWDHDDDHEDGDHDDDLDGDL